MREAERLEIEVRNFKLTVGGLREVINLRYKNIIFEPSLEEVFRRAEGVADLEVSLSLIENENMVPNGTWQDGVFYAELERHRPIFQLQKLVAALYCLDSDNLYPLHCALTQPPGFEKAIAFLGSSKTGKGTIVSRLCRLSDSISGQQPEVYYSDQWHYLADDVLLYDYEKDAAYLIGKVRTRCLNFPEKRVIIEPGDVGTDGYSIGTFVLLDKSKPGGEFRRLEMPVDIPEAVIGHPDIAFPIYQMITRRPGLTITEIPVYNLGTNGNIPGTLEAINKIINNKI